jgi:alpha-L-fucosidase
LEKAEPGQFGGARDVRSKPYTGEDVRFTTKGDVLYAYLLEWPTAQRVVLKSLGTTAPHLKGRKITDVSLLGETARLEWSQEEQGLTVALPPKPPSDHATALKIR